MNRHKIQFMGSVSSNQIGQQGENQPDGTTAFLPENKFFCLVRDSTEVRGYEARCCVLGVYLYFLGMLRPPHTIRYFLTMFLPALQVVCDLCEGK